MSQTNAHLTKISPEEARGLLAQGAFLVDIRELEEHKRERVAGAAHAPLSKLDQIELEATPGQAVLFHCRSGARTEANAPKLAGKLREGCHGYVIEGGLDALKRAGVPVVVDRSQPIEMFRQVQIGAGLFVLVGALLGLFVSPAFFAIPLFVGAGLMFAGITGFCGMARVLMLAPWNRPARTA
jgi:rhodanese-related sulfurtransferase